MRSIAIPILFILFPGISVNAQYRDVSLPKEHNSARTKQNLVEIRKSISALDVMEFNQKLDEQKKDVKEVRSSNTPIFVERDTLTNEKPAATTEKENEESAKSIISSDIDKISYNFDEDPEAQTSTVLEMLSKVPLITVDGDDVIRVRGNTDFAVYVDGKLNNMMTKNPAEIFRNMPANTVTRI